jgi:tRNA modification GTPase
MVFRRKFSTIFALATAPGKAGVGIVRLSGCESFDVLSKLVDSTADQLKHRLLSWATFYDHDQTILDRGMYATFGKPKSFTGEDVVELHIHSSPAVINCVYTCLSRYGLELAKPGEFIQRAWRNGKLDLYQVEATADLLEAETREQRIQAISADRKNQAMRQWQDCLVSIIAHLEASIDFEEEDEHIVGRSVDPLISSLLSELHVHLTSRHGEIVRDGLKVALCGPPNVGKSSLFNQLLKRKAAIVSPIPGTTRDVLSATLDLHGHKAIIYDTAGIHSSPADAIERDGIEKARETIEQCDVVILVSSPDIQSGSFVGIDESKIVKVANKSDMYPLSYPDMLSVSATSGQNIDKLIDMIVCRIPKQNNSPIITNGRHRAHLQQCHDELEIARNTIQAELKAEHVKRALQAVGCILGNVVSDRILDAIFSSFCIGK